MVSIKQWLVGNPVPADRVEQLRRQLAQQAQGPMTRRAAMTGGAAIATGAVIAPMAGQGGLNPPPLNAPPAGLPTSGVQPGVSNNIVLARLVIVSGLGIDGVYVYAAGTKPGPGNPPISWESSSLVDPFGNPLPSATGVAGVGIFTATGADGSKVQITAGTSAEVDLFPASLPAGASSGSLFAEAIGGGPGGQLSTVIFAPAFAGQSPGAVALISQSQDGTTNPVSAFSFQVGQISFSNSDVWIFPTGDTTGVTDSALIGLALLLGQSVQLGSGIYYLSGPASWANAQLKGTGDTTSIQPGSAWVGAALLEPGSNTSIMNLAGNGGTSTRSANKAANFIQTQAGAQFWRVEDVRCDFMNGQVIQCAPATGSHGTIRCIKGEHNAGGIRIDNGTAANVTAEINVTDIDLQNCEVSAIFFIQDVTDVLMAGPMNGSILSTSTSIGVHVVGSCQTCFLFGLDVGGGNGTAQLQFDSNATGSPTEIEVGPGTLQQGNIGIAINAGSRLAFNNVWAKSNNGDGWLIAGTAGAGIVMTGCGGNGNNAAGGTAYDVDVTDAAAHVLNVGFRYISGGVTAGRFLVAANHYTEGFAPSSMTQAGAAAGGW
jgi:hypothetical protein